MPDRREVSRELVAGSWDAVSPRNFRATFGTLDEALEYVASAGLIGVAQIYAVIRVQFGEEAPKTKRRGWARLKPQTQRDYLGSSQAQAEAKVHGMTVPEWYEVAPDLKAFRRHVRGRVGTEGRTGFEEEFLTYISRKYKGLPEDAKLILSEAARQAWLDRADDLEEDRESEGDLE